MRPKAVFDCLVIASGAKTDEEKARIAWRFNDAMWRRYDIANDLAFCRHFNDLLQQQDWPWVEDLWSKEEVAEIRAKLDAMMPKP